MEKGDHGHTEVTRTADIPAIKALIEEGITLGSPFAS